MKKIKNKKTNNEKNTSFKLEKHLILNKYFLNLFGCNEFKDLREKLKDTQEGYDNSGRSYFVNILIGLKSAWE